MWFFGCRHYLFLNCQLSVDHVVGKECGYLKIQEWREVMVGKTPIMEKIVAMWFINVFLCIGSGGEDPTFGISSCHKWFIKVLLCIGSGGEDFSYGKSNFHKGFINVFLCVGSGGEDPNLEKVIEWFIKVPLCKVIDNTLIFLKLFVTKTSFHILR